MPVESPRRQHFTANAQAGSYTITASATGAGSASFSLTNSFRHGCADQIFRSGEHAPPDDQRPVRNRSLVTGNAAGNWIGVVIYGGNGSNTFTITDTNGNTYRTATSFGSKTINTTLGVFYAENIKAGANTVKVIPNSGVYLRIVVLEYAA